MNCYVSLNKNDILQNINNIKNYVRSRIIAVVKCNGYGIGIENAVNFWYKGGIRFFGVSEPREALYIRELGYDDVEILLLTPTWDERTLRLLIDKNVILTVTSPELAAKISQIGQARAHVKLDIGMGRFGVKYTDFERILAIYDTPGIDLCGIFGHFPGAFLKDSSVTMEQFSHFTETVKKLEAQGIDAGLRHVANSSAALRFPETQLDACRIGSALVGRLIITPPFKLNRIGIVKAQVADISYLEEGQTTGYSMVYTAPERKETAVISCGYTDGWEMERFIPSMGKGDAFRAMKRAWNQAKRPRFVKWGSQKLPILGRVGTQYTVVDRSGCAIMPGDWVEIDINPMLVDSGVERRVISG